MEETLWRQRLCLQLISLESSSGPQHYYSVDNSRMQRMQHCDIWIGNR
jgi:hypothetical protein